jgi:hypothetical protein
MLLPLLASYALAFDDTHAGLQKVLDTYVVSGRVDYARLHADHAALDAYLAELTNTSLDGLTAGQKKALYINAYNGWTLRTLADAWPVTSPRDVDGGKMWDTRHFNVAGKPVSLNDIENKILRPLGDPRIHAALNCGAVGCPPLSSKVYTGAALESQLDGAAKRWAATAQVGTTVSVNQIFDWYGDDFLAKYGPSTFDIPGLDGKAEAAANFVAAYAPDKAAALHKGGYTVTYVPYDWAINAKK